jgi:hypothetical protein
MVTIYTLTHSDFWPLFCGLCAFAVTMALLRNISQQRSDVLPKPRMDCIARGGKDAWTVGPVRVKP